MTDRIAAADAIRQGLTYYVSLQPSADGTPAWAIWRRANIGKPTEFAEREYVLEQRGTRQRPAWVRSCFTSGGWWRSEHVASTRAEALASLTALCERLNQPLEG